MKKAIMPSLSAVMGGFLAYYLKDPFQAALICVPVILIIQSLILRYNKTR